MTIDEVINSLHGMSRQVELLTQLKDNITVKYNSFFPIVDTNINLKLAANERREKNMFKNFAREQGVDKVDVLSEKDL